MADYGHRVPGFGYDSPPVPRDIGEAQRWAYTSRRRRILYGLHRDLVEARLAASVGETAATAWGGVDLSTNLLRLVCDSVSVLYEVPPTLRFVGERGAIARSMEGLCRRVGLWSRLQRVSRDAIGLREQLVRVGYSSRGDVTVRSVRPDRVEAWAHDDDPSSPVRVREWRRRGGAWTADEFCIEDPERPSISILDAGGDVVDVMATGDEYPWRRSDGAAVVPYVWYRAAVTDLLWDPYEWDSLVEGTLHSSVLRSLYAHMVQTSSWKTRYMLNCEAVGAGSSAAGAEIEGDPALILALRTPRDLEPGASSSVGVLDQPGDPLQVLMSIERWEHACVGSVGLPAAELLRSSGDPRSGIALQAAAEGQRSVQRRFVGQFSRSDEATVGLMAIAARLAGVEGFGALPSRGWQVVHPGFESEAGVEPEAATAAHIAATALAAGEYQAAAFAAQIAGVQDDDEGRDGGGGGGDGGGSDGGGSGRGGGGRG